MNSNNRRSVPGGKYPKKVKRRKKKNNGFMIGIAAIIIVVIAVVLLIVCGSKKDTAKNEADVPDTVTDTVTIGADSTKKTPESTQEVTEEVTSETDITTEVPQTTTAALKTNKAPETEKESDKPAPADSGTSTKGYKIEVKDGVTYVGGILIANKTYALPQNYGSGLTDEMNDALDRMFSAAAAEGYDLHVVSGFRSYSRQNTLYNNYCNRDGKVAADTYSARPGHSEHQTGLAADINSVETSWGKTPEGKWLAANCYKYGFIIRYPAGEEDKTGYQYEPWHVRYLGVDTATQVYNSGLCLEEYLGITSIYAD